MDRRCGAGLQAVIDASMMVQTGAADVVLVVGVESMSNIEYYTNDMRWGARAGSVTLHDRLQRGRERSQPAERFGQISGMPETAENLAREFDVARAEADFFAARSHQRAAAAWADGRFGRRSRPSRSRKRRDCRWSAPGTRVSGKTARPSHWVSCGRYSLTER